MEEHENSEGHKSKSRALLNPHLYDEEGQHGKDIDLSFLEEDSRFLESQPFLH